MLTEFMANSLFLVFLLVASAFTQQFTQQSQKLIKLDNLSCNCTCNIPYPVPGILPPPIVPVFQREGPFFFATWNCNAGQVLGYIRATIETGEQIFYRLIDTPYIQMDANNGTLTIVERVPASVELQSRVEAYTSTGKRSFRDGTFKLMC